MNFNSLDYFIFLPLVVLFYYLTPHKIRWLLLLTVSYIFYASWNPRFLPLLIGISLLTYLSGYTIEKTKFKKTTLFFSLILILTGLIYFKYFEFIKEIINRISGNHIENKTVGPLSEIIFPLGISFFTFQSISYVVDVYRNKINAERNPGIVFLFIAYFPQLIAGPIEKAKNLIPQFKEKVSFVSKNFLEGGKLILWGLFKKTVIADSLIVFFTRIYTDVDEYSATEFWLANICYVYYIYCDFSGYSDIALGSSRLFGIRLSLNFFKPFSSTSIREFWSRWHITLYAWLKEYLFNSMGGNRIKSKFKLLIIVLLIFAIMGLWHGPSLNFLIFGLVAGVLVVISHVNKNRIRKLKSKFKTKISKIGFNYFLRIITILEFSLLSIFFANKNFDDSIYIVYHLFDFQNPKFSLFTYSAIFLFIFSTEILQFFQKQGTEHPFGGMKNLAFRFGVYVFLLFAILIYADRETFTFHYFQF